MQRCLAIDVGNTRIKYAFFENGHLGETGMIDVLDVKTLEKFWHEKSVKYIILSSVRHLSKEIEEVIVENPDILVLNSDTNLPFENRYQTPDTLGKDRVAALAGAMAIFPGDHSLVIDAGTCITYDILEGGLIYLGGNISPGLNMRMKAMHDYTDRLPQVEVAERLPFIGEDTSSAMQVGGQQGAVLEMEGFIKIYKEKFGKLNILLTGGDASFFVKRMKTEIFAAPNLVLQGLYEILRYNVL